MSTVAEAERHDEFIALLLQRCDFPQPGTAVICALSGGPDSAALVALAIAAGCAVHAVHVDHGVRESSTVDAQRAQTIASQLGATFRCEHVDLNDGANFEARARAARQNVLGGEALTGHTADDQAETLILALIRGSAARGLAAMTPGPTKPLLNLRRAETHLLCERLGLIVAEDPTNADPRFRRNRVRNELIPLVDNIAQRDITPLLTRTSSLLRDDDSFLDELARTIDPTDAKGLTAAPIPLARRAIRRWLSIDGQPPNAATVARVLDVAAGNAVGCEVGARRRVDRSQQRLRLSPEPDPTESGPIESAPTESDGPYSR